LKDHGVYGGFLPSKTHFITSLLVIRVLKNH